MTFFWQIHVAYNSKIGFLLILEPFETDNATVPNPVFHFTFVHVLAAHMIIINCPQLPRSLLSNQTSFWKVQQCCNHFRDHLSFGHVSKDATIHACCPRDLRYDANEERLPTTGSQLSFDLHFTESHLTILGHHARQWPGSYQLQVWSQKWPCSRP